MPDNIYFDGPTDAFVVHDIAEAEGGYNYYLFIHPKGTSFIMRMNTAETEFRYADAGSAGARWASRATLTYSQYNALRS